MGSRVIVQEQFVHLQNSRGSMTNVLFMNEFFLRMLP